MDFDAKGQLLVIHSAYVNTEKKWEFIESVHQLFIDSTKPMIQLESTSCIIFSLSLVSS